MEKKCIFVYEPTYYQVGLRAAEMYKYLLNKGLSIHARHTSTYSMIYTDIIDVKIGHSAEDLYGNIFDEVFDVPLGYYDSIISRLKSKDGPPFAGTVYDYIDCLISHVRGKGLPTGYFEDMNTILKGGEVLEDSGI